MEHRRDNTKGTDNSTKRSKTEDPSSPHSTAGYDNKLYTDRKHQEKKYDEQFRKDIDDQDAKQRRELRLKATGGWHPSAGDLPNTPEYRLRGGVIDNKLKKLPHYLREDEREILKDARYSRNNGKLQKDLPVKERAVYSMYDAINNHQDSHLHYSNEDIYTMLERKRKSSQYQEAFAEYGQSSQPSMSLQEQMRYASDSDTEQQYDRFSMINEDRKETLKEYAYNLIIPDGNTRQKRITKDDNEFNFVVECLKENLPEWNTTDQDAYSKAYRKLFPGEW